MQRGVMTQGRSRKEILNINVPFFNPRLSSSKSHSRTKLTNDIMKTVKKMIKQKNGEQRKLRKGIRSPWSSKLQHTYWIPSPKLCK